MKQPSPTLLSFDQALAAVLAEVPSQAGRIPETVSAADALGRVLAEDLRAEKSLPECDTSAMDGYCVRHQDIAAATETAPVSLEIAGEIFAGHPLPSLPSGASFYITTGGMIPEEADTVIKIEDVTVTGNRVTVVSAPPKGCYVRPRGREMRKGDVVLSAGEVLTPSRLGVLATLGRTRARVSRKPRVAIFTSGDEVLMAFEDPKPWQVRNSNSPCLCAQVTSAGGYPVDYGIIRDEDPDVPGKIRRALEDCDVCITSGGISMGTKDPFVAAFTAMGVHKKVHGVAIKPGKPFFFALEQGKPVFGLPGNQASGAVTFELFVRPYLMRWQGRQQPDRDILMLPLVTPSRNTTGRDHFMRGFLRVTDGMAKAEPFSRQDSHLISSISGAQLLLRHCPQPECLQAGDAVECRLIGDF
jgi:molybdopterin molybdotransferase